MTSAGPITPWPFMEAADDGDGFITGFKDDAGRIFRTVVPLATDTVLDAVKQELGVLKLEPRFVGDDGVVGVENDGLDGADLYESLEGLGIFSRKPIDALVLDAMELVDSDPGAIADLTVFRDRLARSLAAVESKLAERRTGSS